MKHLLIILILIAFYGCRKCETCTQTIKTTVNVSTPGYPQTITTTFEACGKELKEIDGTMTTSTANSGYIIATSTITTYCL